MCLFNDTIVLTGNLTHTRMTQVSELGLDRQKRKSKTTFFSGAILFIENILNDHEKITCRRCR